MPLIGCASAQIAAQRVSDISFRWMAVSIKQSLGGADKSRRAIPALECIIVDIRLNDGMLRFGYSLGRLYHRSVALACQGHAGEDRTTIHYDGA